MKMVNKSCLVQQMTEKITLEVDAKIRFLLCESLGWQGTRDVYSIISALKTWSSYLGSQVIMVCILEFNKLVGNFDI